MGNIKWITIACVVLFFAQVLCVRNSYGVHDARLSNNCLNSYISKDIASQINPFHSNIAITGSSGFLGAHFAEQYDFEDTQTKLLMRKETSRFQYCSRVIGDLSDRRSLSELVKGVDAVVNFAGDTRTRVTMSDENNAAEIFQTNVFAPLQLLFSVSEENKRRKERSLSDVRVVIASSYDIYHMKDKHNDWFEQARKEFLEYAKKHFYSKNDSLEAPEEFIVSFLQRNQTRISDLGERVYPISKRLMEEVIIDLSKQEGLQNIILFRFMYPVGEQMHRASNAGYLPTFIRHLITNKKFEAYKGDIRYIAVQDVSKVIEELATVSLPEEMAKEPLVVHLAGEKTTYHDICKTVAKTLSDDLGLDYDSYPNGPWGKDGNISLADYARWTPITEPGDLGPLENILGHKVVLTPLAKELPVIAKKIYEDFKYSERIKMIDDVQGLKDILRDIPRRQQLQYEMDAVLSEHNEISRSISFDDFLDIFVEMQWPSYPVEYDVLCQHLDALDPDQADSLLKIVDLNALQNGLHTLSIQERFIFAYLIKTANKERIASLESLTAETKERIRNLIVKTIPIMGELSYLLLNDMLERGDLPLVARHGQLINGPNMLFVFPKDVKRNRVGNKLLQDPPIAMNRTVSLLEVVGIHSKIIYGDLENIEEALEENINDKTFCVSTKLSPIADQGDFKTIYDVESAMKRIRRTKSLKSSPVLIAGGTSASGRYAELLDKTPVSVVLSNYSESNLIDMLFGESVIGDEDLYEKFRDIKGLYVKDAKGRIRLTGSSAKEVDSKISIELPINHARITFLTYDAQKIPYYKYWQYLPEKNNLHSHNHYVTKKTIRVFTCNGDCPYNCKHCMYSPSVAFGPVDIPYDPVPAEDVIVKLEEIVSHFPDVEQIAFVDGDFLLHRARALKIADLIKKSNRLKKLSYYCSTSVHVADGRLLRALREANFDIIVMGLESFDQYSLLHDGKLTSLDTFRRFHLIPRVSNALGFHTWTSIMFFYPEISIDGLIATMEEVLKYTDEGIRPLIFPYVQARSGVRMFEEGYDLEQVEIDISRYADKNNSDDSISIDKHFLPKSESIRELARLSIDRANTMLKDIQARRHSAEKDMPQQVPIMALFKAVVSCMREMNLVNVNDAKGYYARLKRIEDVSDSIVDTCYENPTLLARKVNDRGVAYYEQTLLYRLLQGYFYTGVIDRSLDIVAKIAKELFLLNEVDPDYDVLVSQLLNESEPRSSTHMMNPKRVAIVFDESYISKLNEMAKRRGHFLLDDSLGYCDILVYQNSSTGKRYGTDEGIKETIANALRVSQRQIELVSYSPHEIKDQQQSILSDKVDRYDKFIVMQDPDASFFDDAVAEEVTQNISNTVFVVAGNDIEEQFQLASCLLGIDSVYKSAPISSADIKILTNEAMDTLGIIPLEVHYGYEKMGKSVIDDFNAGILNSRIVGILSEIIEKCADVERVDEVNTGDQHVLLQAA